MEACHCPAGGFAALLFAVTFMFIAIIGSAYAVVKSTE